MKKLVNHIDHVTWISHPDNIEANVARLEQLSGGKFTRFERSDCTENPSAVLPAGKRVTFGVLPAFRSVIKR